MGNCLMIQDRREIKIMSMDGKILTLQSPMKVHQALAEFPPGHAISDEHTVHQHLDPAADLTADRLYYLSPVIKEPVAVDPGVVRVKLVISKQELKKMLNKEAISLDEMVSLMQHKESSDPCESDGKGWRPALESIPEGSDF